MRGSGLRPLPHRSHAGPRSPATPPQRPWGAQGTDHVPTTTSGPRGPATPPRRPCGSNWTGYAPTAAMLCTGDRPRPHGSHGSPVDRPRSHASGHAWPRGPAMPPRQPCVAQGSGHAPMAAMRGPGDRQRPYGGHAGLKGLATTTRRPCGAREISHALAPAMWGPGDQPRRHVNHAGPR